MKKVQHGTSAVSGAFLHQLYNNYQQSILEFKKNKVVKKGVNGYSDFAISSYPIAIAAWEAFLYETMLSEYLLEFHNHATLNKIPSELIDKWSIDTKSTLIPEILYNVTFDKGSLPFQDFNLLLILRNELVHFKYGRPSTKILNVIEQLRRKNVFLPQEDVPEGNILVEIWPHSVSTIEGIRWAINTIAEMAHKLIEFMPEKEANLHAHTLSNFKKIQLADAMKEFLSFGVDPETNNPNSTSD